MNKFAFTKTAFYLSIAVTVFAAWCKLTHQIYGETLLIIGFSFSLLFIVLALMEVFSAKHLERSEKIMWLVGFLFITAITGFVYVISGRKRIVEKEARNSRLSY